MMAANEIATMRKVAGSVLAACPPCGLEADELVSLWWLKVLGKDAPVFYAWKTMRSIVHDELRGRRVARRLPEHMRVELDEQWSVPTGPAELDVAPIQVLYPDVVEAAQVVAEGGTWAEAADAVGIPLRTLNRRLRACRDHGIAS